MTLQQCSICKQSTLVEDSIFFGEWMTRNDITVHYYCLLLSTNLPQRGKDNSGILGFLVSDIRKEIDSAQRRICIYCEKKGASIMCKKCKKYLHLVCGQTNKCLFQFINEFSTYCHSCIPIDEDEIRIVKDNPPAVQNLCYICNTQIGLYDRMRHIHGKCCGNGYAHILCVKKYALSAGYYLKCIWCKDKRFRDDVKYKGVFVPDRDADWELEKGAYKELYRQHRRCDMEQCNCPKGRDYTSGKWKLIICKYCGAYGAHNPGCIPGFKESKMLGGFLCDVCSVTEQTLCQNSTMVGGNTTADRNNYLINGSLYIIKKEIDLTQNRHTPSIAFSEDSESSMETVVHVQNRTTSTTYKRLPNSIIPLTESVFPLEKEIIKTGAINDMDDAVFQEKDQMVVDNQTIDDSDGAVMKVVDKQECLELMDTDVVEAQEEAQTNGNKLIPNLNTACAVANNNENIEEQQPIIIPNAAAYVYPVTSKTIEELRQLNPNAAATTDEKQKIISEIQRINPYGITEVDDSESEDEDESDEDKEDTEVCSADGRDVDLLVEKLLNLFE